MKKYLLSILVLLSLASPPRWAHADQFDDGQAAAGYLEEYQSEQARKSLLLKGLLGLFLAAGVIALFLKNKNKGD